MSRKGNQTKTEEGICFVRTRARFIEKGQVHSKIHAHHLRVGMYSYRRKADCFILEQHQMKSKEIQCEFFA